MGLKKIFRKKPDMLKIAIAVAVCLIIAVAAGKRMLSDKQKIDENNEKITQLQEEQNDLSDEIEYYDYKISKSKDELVEEAAREKGYTYENETKYTNCTPGA